MSVCMPHYNCQTTFGDFAIILNARSAPSLALCGGATVELNGFSPGNNSTKKPPKHLNPNPVNYFYYTALDVRPERYNTYKALNNQLGVRGEVQKASSYTQLLIFRVHTSVQSAFTLIGKCSVLLLLSI